MILKILFERCRGRQKERNSHLLVNFPNTCESGTKTGSRNCIPVLRSGGRPAVTATSWGLRWRKVGSQRPEAPQRCSGAHDVLIAKPRAHLLRSYPLSLVCDKKTEYVAFLFFVLFKLEPCYLCARQHYTKSSDLGQRSDCRPAPQPIKAGHRACLQ